MDNFFKAFNIEMSPILLQFITNTWLDIDNIRLYCDNFMAWISRPPNSILNSSKNLIDVKVLYPLIIPTDFNVSNFLNHSAEFKFPNPPNALQVSKFQITQNTLLNSKSYIPQNAMQISKFKIPKTTCKV